MHRLAVSFIATLMAFAGFAPRSLADAVDPARYDSEWHGYANCDSGRGASILMTVSGGKVKASAGGSSMTGEVALESGFFTDVGDISFSGWFEGRGGSWDTSFSGKFDPKRIQMKGSIGGVSCTVAFKRMPSAKELAVQEAEKQAAEKAAAERRRQAEEKAAAEGQAYERSLSARDRLAIEYGARAVTVYEGVPDGTFEDAFRYMLRSYQMGSDMPVSGYLSPALGEKFLAAGRPLLEAAERQGGGGKRQVASVPAAPDRKAEEAERRKQDEAARQQARLAGLKALDAGLSEVQRQTLQHGLAAAAFYNGAIDGDFGPGTRAAIRAWQTARKAEATGLLTAEQMLELTASGSRRVAEIEVQEKAKAERKRQEEEAKRLAALERERKAEEARKRAEAERRRQEEEAKRLAALEQERKAEEARRRAEAERKRQEEEAKRLAALERERKAEEARRQAEAKRKRQEEEAKRLAALEWERTSAEAARREQLASRKEPRGIPVRIRSSETPSAAVVDEVELYSKSYALVIGIDDYQGQAWPRLANAVGDARKVAKALKQRGFEVMTKLNLDGEALREAFEDFFIDKGSDPDARLFVWYAGHGHTAAGGEGYLIPTDGVAETDRRSFYRTALSLRDFGRYVRQAVSKHVFTVFDSCFAGTIFSVARAAPPAQITRVTTQDVRQFLTSGDAGQQVSDDGTFAKLFVEAILGERRADLNGDGYLTGSEIGAFLDSRISNYTKNRQTPRFGPLRDPRYDKGDFVFVLGDDSRQVPASRSAGGAMTAEMLFWQSIRDSRDPDDFQAYLSQYPQGVFTVLARNKLKALKAR